MKKLTKGIRNVLVIALLLSNIGCDQISKNIARENIEYGEQITVISDFVTLTKVENSGAFLSLGDELPFFLKITLLMIIPGLILIGMLVIPLTKNKMKLNQLLALAFIIGGGIGNLFDRIAYGSVTDFLHMDFQLFRTGIFNMADVSIVIGSLWLAISLFQQKQTDGKLERS